MADLSDLRQRFESARNLITYIHDDRSPTAAEVNERMSAISEDLHAAVNAVDELATELAEERIAHQKTLDQLREAREQVAFEKHRGATLGGDVAFAEFQMNAAHRTSNAWQARAEEAEGILSRFREFLDRDFRQWCSPHGIAARYATDLLRILDQGGSNGRG